MPEAGVRDEHVVQYVRGVADVRDRERTQRREGLEVELFGLGGGRGGGGGSGLEEVRVLVEGEEVREDLRRVPERGQRVEDGHGGVLCELLW